MDKKIIIYNGGLGNQLFQFAYMLYLGKKANVEVDYNISLYKKHSIHSGFQANLIFDFSSFSENVQDFNFFYSLDKRVEKLLHKSIFFNKEGGNENSKPLLGFWQNISIYKEVKNELMEHLLNLNDYCLDSELKKEIIKSNSVFIHIRRGDYCNNSMYCDLSQTSYYSAAIKKIYELVKNPRFYVFSDDLNWAKQYLKKYKDFCYVKYEKQSAIGDLSLMLLCKNAIIANSSFSWWGASLDSKNIVIHPKKYYENRDVLGLYDEQWIEI